jgi:ectoine hydroxylase-related dioxygenase (phytanoyl-CoA dioxygenase family)
MLSELPADAPRMVEGPSGAWRAGSAPVWFSASGIGLEPFRSLKLGPGLGRATARLMNFARLTDDVMGVRFAGDHLLCKRAQGAAESGPTPYHQDSHGGLTDGQLAWWIALDEVTPDMGSMRFLTGCQREGRLAVDRPGQDVLERYPKLLDLYDWSPPLHYRAGDATAHHEFMLHGAPANSTDAWRWGLNIDYIPANAVWPREQGGRHSTVAVLEPDELETTRPLVYP